MKKMNKEDRDIYSEIFQTFDGLKLSSMYERRMATKPLYDFFQILLRQVGVSLLGLDQNSFAVYHLKTRWSNIRIHLSSIENTRIWDDLVDELSRIRGRVEHNDYYDPNAGALKRIRNKVPEFKEWLIHAGKEYYRKSKNFTFKQSFYQLLNSYIMESESIISEFGEKTPHVAESDYSFMKGKEGYEELKELTEILRQELATASTTEDLDRTDLDNLINLVKIISKIRGREELLLRQSICPKCGGKIVETEKGFGDPDTSFGMTYRLGCEKCDYTLHKETIHF